MAARLDLDAWRDALAAREAAVNAQQLFEQKRFTLPESERQAAAESGRLQLAEVEARLAPFRQAATQRRSQAERKLAGLVQQRERLEASALEGKTSPERLNDAHRTLQHAITACAAEINLLARLADAHSPGVIDDLTEDERVLLAARTPEPEWTGRAKVALPRTVAVAGVVALLAAFLPWFRVDGAFTNLVFGVVGESTPMAGRIAGYVGILLPVLMTVVVFSRWRNDPAAIIGIPFAALYVWIAACYVRATSGPAVDSAVAMIASIGVGAWLYALAAVTGLTAACYYALGERSTMRQSVRTAGWLIAIFCLPGIAVAGLITLQDGPPPVEMAVTSVENNPNVLRLSVANNTGEAFELSLPWSRETAYGIVLELQAAEDEAFRAVEVTGDCWRDVESPDRPVNRLTIAPANEESVLIDVSCVESLGYAPARLRFALTDAEGQTVKAFQAVLSE